MAQGMHRGFLDASASTGLLQAFQHVHIDVAAFVGEHPSIACPFGVDTGAVRGIAQIHQHQVIRCMRMLRSQAYKVIRRISMKVEEDESFTPLKVLVREGEEQVRFARAALSQDRDVFGTPAIGEVDRTGSAAHAGRS